MENAYISYNITCFEPTGGSQRHNVLIHGLNVLRYVDLDGHVTSGPVQFVSVANVAVQLLQQLKHRVAPMRSCHGEVQYSLAKFVLEQIILLHPCKWLRIVS